MKFLAALVAVCIALVLNAPFFGALVLGAVAWVVVHYATKGNDETHDVAPDTRTVAEQPTAETGAAETAEHGPDVSEPAALRAYLGALHGRVRTLEEEVSALKAALGGRLAAAPAAQAEDAHQWPAPEQPAQAPHAAPAFSAVRSHVTSKPIEVKQTPSQPETPGLVPEHLGPEVAPRLEPPPLVSLSVAPLQPEAIQPDQDSIRAHGGQGGGGAPTPPEEPAGPAEPSFLAKLLSKFFSGNIVAKVGAIVLFFGVGFLLKFAYDRDMISPELRLAAVALVAIVVFILGWKLLERRRLYGLILQGVASGLAYLDVFFALKTYGFISVPVGFGLFALLGVATTLLAVRQDAKPLAVLGLTGAFLAPVLASTGDGNHVFLFSYYLLLNLFIVAVSWFRAWRVLNITGWFFTLAVAAVWGSRSYTPALFDTVEPFLLAFFAIYLVIPILFATRQPPELKGLVDGTLVFGTPAAVAAIQAKLVWDMPYGLAWSAAIGAALYGVLSIMALRHKNMKLLGETYIALAVGLGTLAIFFAFGAYTTFALWSIEGAAILWVCLRQKHLLGRLFAIFVQVGGALYFAIDFFHYARSNPWFNDAVLGCAIIAVASFISALLLRRYREEITAGERLVGSLILIWGALWWSAGGVDAIHHGVEPESFKPAVIALFFSASAIAAEIFGTRMQWPALRGLTAAHPAILLACAALQFELGTQPLADLGWLAWPLGFASFFWILHRQRRDGFDVGFDVRYAAGWLVLGLVATWQAIWYFTERDYGYVMAMASIGYLAAALRFWLRERDAETTTTGVSGLPLVWALVFWFSGGMSWIHADVAYAYEPAAIIVFVTASALAAELAGAAMRWSALRGSSALHPVLLTGAALLQFSHRTHPLGDYGWLAWALGLGVLFLTLHRQRRDGFDVSFRVRYGAAWALLVGLATWEALWWLDKREYLYTMAIALVGYVVAGLRFRLSELGTERTRLSTPALLWSMFFWFAAGWLLIRDRLPAQEEARAALLLVAGSAFAYELVHSLLAWPAMRAAARLPWVAIPGALMVELMSRPGSHPFGDGMALAWPVALGLALWALHREESKDAYFATGFRHTVMLYVPLALLTWELLWWIDHSRFGGAWLVAGLAVPASLALLAVTAARDIERWPMKAQWPLYRDRLLLPIVGGLGLWAFLVNVRAPGGLEPLGIYVPFLNPIDVAIALAVSAVIAWGQCIEREEPKHTLWKGLAILGFAWINAMALRTIHYWADVPYRFEYLMNSVLVQATLSILWTSTALALMVLARRHMERRFWIAGAALLAVVVGKLFLVDLANTGTVARIVSFLGVGVMLLVIGYVAPVPPGVKEADGGGGP
jgi:uncharacterized membrane protein